VLPGPCRGNRRCGVGPQQIARGLGFGTPFSKRAIQLNELDCQASQVIANFVEGGLDGIRQQPQDQRREGNQHGNHELDKLDHVPAAVTLRQEWADS
jgi:hypothetical protein